MNAKPGEFTVRMSLDSLVKLINAFLLQSLWHIITYTGKLGPMGFFKVF
jgi:hypothetical protein